MLQVTVAIADFMWILLSSAATAGAGIASGVGATAAGGYVAYRVVKKRRAARDTAQTERNSSR